MFGVEVALFFLMLFLYALYRDRRPPNMPPGPWSVPFLGSAPLINQQQVMDCRKKYGDIVTVRTGSRLSVTVFDYQTAKDVLASPEFTGRPPLFEAAMVDEQRKGGVSMNNGIYWQHGRRFLLRNLRNFGLGKSYLEEAIALEAQALVEDLRNYNEEPIFWPNSFRTAPLNIIWQMVAGRRYDLRSPEVESIYQATKDLYNNSTETMIAAFFPVVLKIPKMIRRLVFKGEPLAGYVQKMSEIVDKTVIEHEEEFDGSNTRDLIDEYLLEMKTKEEKGEDHLMRRGDLRQIIADVFDAGSDTISQMVRWVVFLLVRHPDIADRLLHELDEAVPRDRMASVADRPRLPLLDAFLTETMRYSSFIILNMDHTATCDTTIAGYNIPKDTVISVCLHTIHRDPRFWEDPDRFHPDRFLGEDGQYQPPHEGFALFSSGRRQCPGEALARTELFLFTAALLQNFEILLPEGAVLDEEIQTNSFSMRLPKDQKFIYKSRV